MRSEGRGGLAALRLGLAPLGLLVPLRLVLVLVLLLGGFGTAVRGEEGAAGAMEIPPGTRMLTIRGRIDPRLVAYVETVFRPTKFEDEKACLSKNRAWTTASRKAVMKWDLDRVEPDGEGRYTVTQPIDYLGGGPCGYEYVSTAMVIRRDWEDDLYASIPILDRTNRPLEIMQGHKTGDVSWWPEGYRRAVTERNHFRISSGSRVVCFTKRYAFSPKGPPSQSVAFVCFPLYAEEENGVDELASAVIELDVVVDEGRNRVLVGQGVFEKDTFRDYERPPTRWERLKRWLMERVGRE